MFRLPAIVLGFILLSNAGLSEETTVRFEGEAENERIRVLTLLTDCRDLASIEALIGKGDWQRVMSLDWPGTGYTDKGPCCTLPTTIHFRRIRYASVSPLVDLDVITAGKGIVLAILITEKQPQAD